jgi:ABC-type transporter Mla subunit MlaD
MNNARRKQISEAIEHMNNALSLLYYVRDEEQEVLDNLPDNMRDGERALKFEDNIDQIDYAIGNLEDAITDAEELL